MCAAQTFPDCLLDFGDADQAVASDTRALGRRRNIGRTAIAQMSHKQLRRIISARRICRALLKQLFRRNRQTVGDFRRAVGDLKQAMAYGTAKLDRMSLARIKFDAPAAGIAFGANDVAFPHASDYARAVSPFNDSRSFQSQAKGTNRCSFVLGTLFAGGELRTRRNRLEIRKFAQPARTCCVGCAAENSHT